MSERIWTSFEIGGKLKRERLEAFQEVLRNGVTDLQWNDTVDFSAQSFVCKFNGELRNADSDEITGFLWNQRLSYSIQIGGNGTDFLPEWRGWHPHLNREVWKLTDPDGEILMTEFNVKDLIWKILRDKKTPRTKIIDKYFPPFAPIPPLTLIG
jgi:hypothetical protein